MSENNENSRASSSSTPSSQVTGDDHTIATIFAQEEENALKYGGAKLGKRLSHLDSIPHTPRVIGEIPDPNDATLDHERLSGRLATYGLAEMQIEGDGNCQFRALSDQLYHNPEYHKHVRKEVVKQLKHFRKLYEGYIPMKYKSYLRKMKRLGEWGDHVTLQAAADRFGVKICLVTSFRDNGYIEILPKDVQPSRGIYILFVIWIVASWCLLKGSLGTTVKVVSVLPIGHRFEPWNQPLMLALGWAAYITPLWGAALSRTLHDRGMPCAPGCPS